MHEHRLRPRTLLGGTVPKVDKVGTITVRENSDLALASVAARLGQAKALSDQAEQELGMALPEPGYFAASKAMRSFWIGPEQWMFEAPYETHGDLDRQLKAIFAHRASITEQSDGWSAFEVEGDACVSLFERLCSADLKRLKSGDVVRSSIEHMSTVIFCNESQRSFSLRGAGSTANSLHHSLVTAARSIA